MLRFETAGESHGECLVATLTGLPAGIPISLEAVNRELWRRQQGYGRGGRMKIETDRAEIVAGVRHSHTIGSPVAILIRNRDWQNWTEALPVEDVDGAEDKRKPGHPAAAGPCRPGRRHQVQFSRCPLHPGARQRPRDRPRAWRWARSPRRCCGEFGIEVLSHVIAVGPVRLERAAAWEEMVALSRRDEVLLGCVDADTEARMKAVVDEAYRTGDTVGGVFEVVARGVPAGPGLAHHLGYAAGRHAWRRPSSPCRR